MPRRRSAVAVAAVAFLVVAGSAQASTTWETGDTLYYVAGDGEANGVSIDLQGANATVQDMGYPAIGMTAPCRPWDYFMLDGTGALCPAAPVARVVVDLGDGSDTLSSGAMTQQPLPTVALAGSGNDSLWSGGGGDDLTGGTGEDVIRSSGGNDFIDARDGDVDTIDCGDGNDIALVDAADNITNCETIVAARPAEHPTPVVPTPPQPTITATRWTPPTDTPADTPTPTDPGSALPPKDVHLRIAASTVRLGTARTAGLPVRASCGAGCHVTAVVRVTQAQARRLRVQRTLARDARTSAANGTARLRMRLRGASLAKVRTLNVTIHVQATTSAGQHLVQDIELKLRH
jgi:Ca2+-binding RTX toxin-like protein